MDWKRVESILIAALVITNLIVGFALYNSSHLSHSEILKFEDREKIVKDLLKEKNIIVDAKLNNESVELPNIHLTYEIYEDEGFISLILGNDYKVVGNKYIAEDAQVIVKDSQNLVYQRTVIPAEAVFDSARVYNDDKNKDKSKLDRAYSTDILVNKNLKDDELRVIALAEGFLKEKGIKNQAVRFWKVVKLEGDSYCVKYRQYENEKFLEDAYMDVIVTGNYVVELDRKWFGSIVQDGTYSKIESPLLALFRLISIMDEDGNISENRRAIKREIKEDNSGQINNSQKSNSKPPIKIISLDIVYRLVSDIVPIRFLEGDSSMYWRIEMDSGKVVYMKAKEIR